MSGFDRRRLRRSFGRAAVGYAEVAALQREVEARLLEQLDYLDERQPARILDLGSGPGRASGAMKKRWPQAEVIAVDAALPMLRQVPKHTRFWRPVKRVCADVAHLPFADQSADVLFSSLCLQWVEDLPAVLSEFRRVLRPEGLLLFSTFGPDTLIELREAYLQAGDASPPLSSFAAIQQVGDALMAAGFRDPVLDRDHFTLTYPDLRALMGELKAIGANDARRAATAAPTWPASRPTASRCDGARLRAPSRRSAPCRPSARSFPPPSCSRSPPAAAARSHAP